MLNNINTYVSSRSSGYVPESAEGIFAWTMVDTCERLKDPELIAYIKKATGTYTSAARLSWGGWGRKDHYPGNKTTLLRTWMLHDKSILCLVTLIFCIHTQWDYHHHPLKCLFTNYPHLSSSENTHKKNVTHSMRSERLIWMAWCHHSSQIQRVGFPDTVICWC